MNEQLSIFDQPVTAPRARRQDPETSKTAANKAAAVAVSHHNIIMAALDRPGNIYDLAKRTGLNHVAIARRMIELERQKRAHPTEEKREGCRLWAKGPKPKDDDGA